MCFRDKGELDLPFNLFGVSTTDLFFLSGAVFKSCEVNQFGNESNSRSKVAYSKDMIPFFLHRNNSAIRNLVCLCP